MLLRGLAFSIMTGPRDEFHQTGWGPSHGQTELALPDPWATDHHIVHLQSYLLDRNGGAA
eukprot:6831690-Pyramimonas_sp.AAC.1